MYKSKYLYCQKCGRIRLSFKYKTSRVVAPDENRPYWMVRGGTCKCGSIVCIMVEEV